MVSIVSTPGASSPFQAGAGDVFLSIYAQSSSTSPVTSNGFDSSGVAAIIAAYSNEAAVVDLSSAVGPREESSLTVAEDAVVQVLDRAVAIQDLAYVSADPFATDQFRRQLQAEVQGLVADIQNIAKSTSYNGEKLFDGSTFKVSVGGGREGSIQASGIDLEGLAQSLSNLNVSSFEGARAAFEAVEDFSQRVVRVASRSLDSAEARISTISNSLDMLSATGTSPSLFSLSPAPIKVIEAYRPSSSAPTLSLLA